MFACKFTYIDVKAQRYNELRLSRFSISVAGIPASESRFSELFCFQANSTKLLPLQIMNSPCGFSDDDRMINIHNLLIYNFRQV